MIITIILFCFPSVEVVAEVFDDRINYQGHQYDVAQFLQCQTFIVMHFINGEVVC